MICVVSMAYSKVEDPVIKVKRRAEHVLTDGTSEIQELGYIERKTVRLYWITSAELQNEIETYEADVTGGWIIDGEPSVTQIQEPLDLYNAVITLHRYVSS